METLIKKAVKAESGEIKALLWSFGYFFFLLSTYYMLLPLRDAMGIEGGTRNLSWLFAATFIATLVTAPFQAALVARLPRRTFIPVVYLFLVANMVVFWALMSAQIAPVIVARAFFIWITVFSVFTVSVFWSFMADLYSTEQSKRLFGFIGAGGSIGSILGPMITGALVQRIGVANLLLIAGLLLVLAVVCANRLEGAAGLAQAAQADFKAASAGRQKAVGGGMFDGFTLLFKSPYLGGIGLWVFLLSFAGTMLYFVQADVVAAAATDTATRTQIFAQIAKWVGILSLLIQLLATGRIIKAIGTGPAAALLPLVFVVGFIAIALNPAVLLVVAGFQAVQRATNFGIANLARESLWTVVSREEKFKAKNIIDGSVFRAADAVNAQVFNGLHALMAVPALAGVAAVISGSWVALSLALGRTQERKAKQLADQAAAS
ncbi:MAG: MFS transporter [Proteobacteria bacterium]|nr:MFS transporter [Pseudomonadota bacterium]